jgi:hypothetical protein
MPSTYSDLKIELINTGSQAGTWGTTTNTNLGTALEEAITGIANAEFGSDANLTLGYSDDNASQVFRNLVLDVTSAGALTATRDLIVPTIEKQYLVWNGTSGAQSIVVKTASGTGVTVPNGAKVHVIVDGTNVVEAINRINQTSIPQNKVLTDTDSSQTLTNKTIAFGSNTLTDVSSTNTTQTLTNKTINGSNNTITNVSLTTGVTGTLPVANGGTGQTSYTNGQLLIGNTTGNTLTKATLTAGTGITVTNGTGSISVTNSLPMTYPGAGIAVSTGSAWGTSKTTPTGDVVGTTDTQTLSSKRVNPRVVAASATTGTITPNGDTTDVYKAEGLTGAITIDVPSGTPVDGQKLMVRLEDDGTERAITWTTSAGGFRAIGITLPTTTTATKITYVGCVYNATDSFWDAVATVTEA